MIKAETHRSPTRNFLKGTYVMLLSLLMCASTSFAGMYELPETVQEYPKGAVLGISSYCTTEASIDTVIELAGVYGIDTLDMDKVEGCHYLVDDTSFAIVGPVYKGPMCDADGRLFYAGKVVIDTMDPVVYYTTVYTPKGTCEELPAA